MAITPGTRIGPYEVTSQLGEGAMGVVLRARDTKLLRDVALKLLPDHFANDPDRLSRLQREAQVLASLNHPNIAHIYGLEQIGAAGCIVMELVEGEMLADKLKNGAVPLDEALEIAKQIADALAVAHERGIVHRRSTKLRHGFHPMDVGSHMRRTIPAHIKLLCSPSRIRIAGNGKSPRRAASNPN